MLDRLPQRLKRILIVATAIYFIGFIWTFTKGALILLFNPLHWEMFYLDRSYAEAMYDRWYFYGSSFFGLLTNLIIFLAAIVGIYFAYKWIAEKSK